MIANAKRANASDEYVAVTSIPIADQITGELLPTTGCRQLVGDPFRRWVRCDAKPQDLSPAVTHDQQSIAERVRTIFRSYLRLGSLNRLMLDLRRRGIVTKVRTLKTGQTIGGIPFTRGPLAQFLRNRFFIGEVVFKGDVLPGEQPAIVDRDLFEAVQVKLSEQQSHHVVLRTKSEALLIGRIFDDRGNRMSAFALNFAAKFSLLAGRFWPD
jgi:hypothetical protein